MPQLAPRSKYKVQIELLPMSDGGDGFGGVVSALLRATPLSSETVYASHRACSATWWWEPKTKTAIVESARIIGLLAFLGAKLEPGFELFARLAKLDGRLRRADVVITGEGAVDKSTLMGKGVGEIARRCFALKIPWLGLAGTVPPECRKSRLFAQIKALTDLTSVARAKANPTQWLKQLAAKAASEFHR